MKLMYFEIVENCLEGLNVYDGYLDENINEDFVEKISRMGKFIFMKDIPKPYFRVIVRGKYTIKGSIGNDTIRIILPDGASPDILNEIKNYINNEN